MNKEIEKLLQSLIDEREEINEYSQASKHVDDDMVSDINRLNILITALEAQQADMWIPITEKSPKDYSEVYVTTQSGGTYHVFYSDKEYRFGNYISDLVCRQVIAWMPFYIPVPYKEEQP